MPGSETSGDQERGGRRVRVLAIVPAGSDRRAFRERTSACSAGSLFWQYTAEAAERATGITRTILSTDDPEIAASVGSAAWRSPFFGPRNWRRDETPTLPCHPACAWNGLKSRGDTYDAVCLLEPTSPLRQRGDDRRLPRTARGSGRGRGRHRDARARPVQSSLGLFSGPGRFLPAQYRRKRADIEASGAAAAYCRDGSRVCDQAGCDHAAEQHLRAALLGYVVEDGASVNIDTLDDWRVAEELLALVRSGGRR